MRRRTVLARLAGVSGLGTAASLAGCLGSGGGTPSGDLDDHPAGRTLENQPWIGAPPAEAERLIVAFEDPSCPNCRSFHQGSFEDVRSEIVEPDGGSFLWRPMRYTSYPWQTPACHAILETTSRSTEAGWALVSHYYDEQSSFSRDTVLDRTESFLASNTDVDAPAAVEAADARAHQELLQAIESEAQDAEVNSTPTFHLFENGSHVTKINGGRDVTFFEAAFEA